MGDEPGSCPETGDGPEDDEAQLETSVQRALPPGRRVLLAVSGGGDSMALLHLAARMGRACDLHVATVDHGLRAEAAEEARTVGRIAHTLHIGHSTLTLTEPPANAADAREARYEALARKALGVDASAILTGHTATDQRETLAMRALRMGCGSSTRGLSGIPQRSTYALSPDLRVVIQRPLLDVPREVLRSLVDERWKLPVTDDPSNIDPRHERARLRLAQDHGRSIGAADWTACAIRLARASGAMRAFQSLQVAKALNDYARLNGDCVLFRPPAALPEHVRAEALATILLAMGGLPTRATPEQMRPILDALAARHTKAHALRRCIIDIDGGTARIGRETRNPARDPVPGTVHDGRFWVREDGSLTPFIAALERFRPVCDDTLHDAVTRLLTPLR